MINRNNYEEFLLMYVDNELTVQERAAVELFVQQNPDLLPELETLQQTVLCADDAILFDDKAGLLKINSSIGIDNYEEYFLLDIDDELDAKKKDEVEKFVLQHPKLQEEFTLLKQTVLKPEQIVFEDKKSLYRNEERRIVPFSWMRLAVAAAVTGFAVLVWWMFPAGKKDGELANTKPVKENRLPAIKDSNNNIQQQMIKPEQQTTNDIAFTADKKGSNNLIKGDKIKTTHPVIKNNAPLNENTALNNTQDNQKKSSLPQETIPAEKDDIIAYQEPVIIDNGDEQTAKASFDNHTSVAANNLVKPAIYKELDTEDDTNGSLYVGNLNLNKNKLRGVIKKVGGLFAGKAKNAIASNDQGKLQVANLEFNKN